MNKGIALIAGGMIILWTVVLTRFTAHFSVGDCISLRTQTKATKRVVEAEWGYYIAKDLQPFVPRKPEVIFWRHQMEYKKQECPISILPVDEERIK